ncbi:integrase, catalytic region, zinc finger, CCHC-type containing protein [Tanacetum coccineum]|uniref:Integrase, catalytic region, zinc finger, CCHC-type containing protein n=1 Tax=Tanacetum coccineum TaxID=301880 RepID=A0ABQ4XAD0_9ASTR
MVESLFSKFKEDKVKGTWLDSVLSQKEEGMQHGLRKKYCLFKHKLRYGINVLSEVVQIVLGYLDSGCSKYMTRNRSQLINFISKFLGTARFGNDKIANIMGYKDYQLGNVMISRVYYVEGLGYNFFSVGQFYDSDLEVAFHKHTCHIRDLEGVDLLKGSRGSNLYTLSLENMMSTSPICLLSKESKTKSWLWHRRLSYLNFDYITQLAKQGMVRRLPRLKFLKYHLCSACALRKRLVPNPPSSTSYVPPTKNDWDILFQPTFDELLNPPPSVVSPVPAIVAQRPTDPTGSSVSTLIDQDAPSSSNPSTQEHEQSLIISQGVKESPKTPHFYDDPLHETLHKDSTSQGPSVNVWPSHTPLDLLGKWTKNHPLENVIGDPSRSISTRKQLKTDAMWCYFGVFLTSVEPKC